jgi:hypothetical protein
MCGPPASLWVWHAVCKARVYRRRVVLIGQGKQGGSQAPPLQQAQHTQRTGKEMVTLINGMGERVFAILQAMYDFQPQAREMLNKLVSQGLTHEEVDRVYAMQYAVVSVPVDEVRLARPRSDWD